MIGSFWNLCRACPSMPVDKQLHSEYRSTYRWHEFTGSARPAVVRRAPVPNPNQFTGATNEPPLPRRKKCPELAYKSHEFIIGSEYTDARNNAANRMPRSEDRNGTPSRRSKSEGPPAVPNGRAYPIPMESDETDTKQAGESSQGLLKKTISKLSTEYRLQFVWPNVRRIKGPIDTHIRQQQQQQPLHTTIAPITPTIPTTTTATTTTTVQPKKSISMGAIRSQQYQQQQQQQVYFPIHHHHIHHYQQPQSHISFTATLPSVHKKRTTNQKEATLHELEPLVSDADDRKPIEKQVTIMERKVTSRPFSQLLEQERSQRFITKKADYGFEEVSVVDNKQQQEQQQVKEQQQEKQEQPEQQQQQKESADALDARDSTPAVTKKDVKKTREVVLNGSAPPHSKPNLDLWLKEVIELRKKAGEYKCRGWGIEIDPDLYKKQKDLWEQVSKNTSLSALSLASAMHRPITKEEKEQENNKKTVPGTMKSYRGRVPGQALFFDNKDEVHALPARFNYMRHHLERTTGPDVEEGALLPSPTREKLMPAITKRDSISQRGSPKKTALSRHGSPQKGSPQKGSPKKVVKLRSQSVGPDRDSPKRQIRSASTAPTATLTPRHAISGKKVTKAAPRTTSVERRTRPCDTEEVRDTAISVSSCSPQPPTTEIAEEPLVKSPPEPTRVKSPEQIIMRSPDPVNWTVPLDTGKTFTVTQNVKEGETYSRPQSEIKASTPIEKPPPPPQSAPPELTDQVKMDVWKNAETDTTTDMKTSFGSSSPTSDKAPLMHNNNNSANGNGKINNNTNNKFIKSLPGTTIRVLEDPLFDIDVVMASSAALQDPIAQASATAAATTSLLTPTSKSQLNPVSGVATDHTTPTAISAVDVLEKARDRFERFWGATNNNAKEERV